MDDRVNPDVMNDVFLPLGRYVENVVSISQLKVLGWGGLEGGYLKDIEGS